MMAVWPRKLDGEVIAHGDQGSQYGSDDWQCFCRANNLAPGMSRRGNCQDNAVAESFFSSLKKERIRKRIYQTRDLARADIGIRCGQGDWPGVNKTWLMDEEAVLVCSPHLVPSGKMACSEWLATQKLIHDDTPHPGADFPSWNDVLMAVGAPDALESGLHINSTSAVILSALSGRGVAIVRYALVKKLIETGQLAQLHPDHRWPLKWSYYLVTPQQKVMRDEVKVFHDWLLQDVVSDRS